jgi:hypothetical protein
VFGHGGGLLACSGAVEDRALCPDRASQDANVSHRNGDKFLVADP